MVKRFLFITTSNLATNPRLVKELRTCVSAGHETTVLSFDFENWSKVLNNHLMRSFGDKVQFITLPGDRRNKFAWATASAMSIISGCILRVVPGAVCLQSLGSFKQSWILFHALRKLKPRYDFVVAHNPGTFVPSLRYARKWKISLGIDLEDYHPGENAETARVKRLENIVRQAVSNANVVTAASPLILKQSLALVANRKPAATVIRNVFARSSQPLFNALPASPLKLIWFSQTVGLNRGIQDVLRTMNLISRFSIQLTIVGNCSAFTKGILTELLKVGKHRLTFLPPMLEESLIQECSAHHIGLALEPGFSLNNTLALSNKLFTYLLAGNTIIASETLAQKKFMEEFPSVGKTYPVGDVEQLVKLLLHYAQSPCDLLRTREAAYQLAKGELNWELESQKFIQTYGLN